MKKSSIIAVLAVCALFDSAFCRIIDVPGNYSTIQAGINASSNGDTVLVQPGTYFENVIFNGRRVLLGSLFIMTGDTAMINTTIIDGDSSGSVITFSDDEDSTAIITGFTITNGFGFRGGGIYCFWASPTIYKNKITENVASGSGGGIACANSSAIIRDNLITGNNATLDDDFIRTGGGIYCDFSGSSKIIGNYIGNNRCGMNGSQELGFGGGIYCETDDAYIGGNIILRNYSSAGAAGIGLYSQTAVVENNVVAGNSCDYNRGGRGGGIHCALTDATLLNNIIFNNRADVAGGGLSLEEGSQNVTNCIVWGNIAPQGPNIYDWEPLAVVTYCDVQGGWTGIGNINANPLFRDTAHDDLRLMSTECGYLQNSPCIDAGHPLVLDSLLSCDWGLGDLESDIGAYAGGVTVENTPHMIIVPVDQATVQAAIDTSQAGDTIIVMPGTYVENLHFRGLPVVLGSMFVLTGNPTFISSTIIDGNRAGSVVTFENNEDSNTVITGFVIRNGYAGSGGGIFCLEASPIIKNNIIRDNTAYHEYGGTGGGMCCQTASPRIIDNLILNNISNGVGGGLFLAFSNSILHNNMIVGNQAFYPGGGGLYITFSAPIMIDNTIANNNSSSQGGAMLCWYNNSITIENSIIWGNSASSDPNISSEETSDISLAYCDIEGGWEGMGNIDINPLFRDPQTNDYHLMSISCGGLLDSPCIDAGNPGIIDSILACNWGLGSERSDIGACGDLGAVLASACGVTPGDANNSGGVDGLDVTYCVNYFKGFGLPPPIMCNCGVSGMLYASGDANGNCSFNGVDVTYIVNFIKGYGQAPRLCLNCLSGAD